MTRVSHAFPAMHLVVLCSGHSRLASNGYFWMNLHEKNKTVEKELHADHVHFLYTVYAASCIYIHGWYRETKMARGRREPWEQKPWKFLVAVTPMYMGSHGVCNRKGIFRYYIYRPLIYQHAWIANGTHVCARPQKYTGEPNGIND